MSLIRGEVFGSDWLISNLPFLAFLLLLGLVYIGLGYAAEDTVRDINANKNELKERRSEYITIKSDLMYATKQSELIKILNKKGLNLEEAANPPKKIELSQKEWDKYFKEANDGKQ
ncbi:MAG TPA: hypothetical protein DDX92_04580 [Flavobacteriales bacterium]|jgi:ABC-type transport system involved in cytochrome bd biosynthesis fused ATPase/permease subunit|nr:hypothetical protein [Flavobacteriales bacterium]